MSEPKNSKRRKRATQGIKPEDIKYGEKPEKSLDNVNKFEDWVTEDSDDLTDAERVELHLEIEKVKSERSKDNKLIKALKAELLASEERFKAVLEIKQPIRPPVIKVRSAWEKKEAVPVFVASDWHVEERVDLDQVNGLNEYNPDISRKRATQYFESCLWLLETYRSTAKIDKAVLAILGDMITGYIHEELKESNWLSPTEAVLLVQEYLCAGIDLLLNKGKFQELLIPCCYGNHGRVHPQKVISTAAQNSFEWLMYHYIASRYKNDNRVTFYIPNGYHNLLEVFDTKIRFHHGDHVNYGGGIGGLTIPLNKKIARWNTTYHANIDVIGHFHQLLDGGNFIVNGSLIGWNAYASSIGASFEPPRQAFFLVRPGRGKSATAPIFVD